MARQLVVEWREDAATLQRLYQRERDGPQRTRWHALWLLRSGQQLCRVAQTLGVAPRTLQNWVRWYREGGLVELRRHRMGGPRRLGACRLTPAQQEGLRALTRTGTCYRVADAIDWVVQEYGVSYSYWGMWALLHRLRLRPKRPRPQAAKASLAAQATWKGGANPSADPARDHPR
jgi:transposase